LVSFRYGSRHYVLFFFKKQLKQNFFSSNVGIKECSFGVEKKYFLRIEKPENRDLSKNKSGENTGYKALFAKRKKVSSSFFKYLKNYSLLGLF
jgi:hypothetical protein